MRKHERLEKLERLALPVEITVYRTGRDGLVRRYDTRGELLEVLTRAQFEALPGEKIYVKPKERALSYG